MALKITGQNGEDQRLTWGIQRWATDELSDSFWNDSPVMKKMLLRKRIVRDGLGLQIVVPLKYPKPGGPNIIGITDPTIRQAPKAVRGITRAKMEVSELMMTMMVPIREVKLAKGTTAKMNVIQTWLSRNKDQWGSDFQDMLWKNADDSKANGTEDQTLSLLCLINKGNTSATAPTKPYVHPAQSTQNTDGNGWTAALHGATPARDNGVTAANVLMTIGGVNRDAADGAYFSCPTYTSTTPGTLGRDLLNKLVQAGTRNRDRIDLMVFQRDLWASTLSIIQAQQLYQPSKLTDYGFQAFSWMGIDCVSDDNLPDGLGGATTGQIVGVNTKNLAYYCDNEDADIEEGPVDIERALFEWRALWYGQLVPSALGRGLGCRHNNVTKP